MQEGAAMARADRAKWLRLALAPLAVALCLWRAGPRFLLAGAAGSVHDVLRDRRLPHRVEVVAGVREPESAALLRDFFSQRR